MSLYKVQNRFLKAMAWIILFGSSAYLFNRCEGEKSRERSYPRVKTNPVSGITGDGATFNGEIYSLGTEQIIEHGFVWSNFGYPDLADNKILLGASGAEGSYSAQISTSLLKDVDYTVKSFVQTAEHVVYGLPVTFKSLGSGAPVIIGFAPDSAAWLDTIKISGKNFSYEKGENIVRLNQSICPVITATDTLLIVEMGANVSDLKNIVSVEISGNISVLEGDSLKLITPVLTDFTPAKALWGDTLLIRGKHFKSFNSASGNNVQIGGTNCVRVGQLTDTSLLVKVTPDLAVINSDLTMKINGINLAAKNKFELLSSYFTFSPKTAIWGNTITLDGRFNPVASKNTISFYSNNIYTQVYPQDIVSTSLSRIIIKVPNNLQSIKSAIIYRAQPFTITSTDTFRIPAPIIRSFSPVSGPTGTSVTINGKYFDVTNRSVMFGGTIAYPTFINDSVIIANVPDGISGNLHISVTAKQQTTVSTDFFNVTNPRITGISPLTGTFNDEITITGTDLLPASGEPFVTFDGIMATVSSFNSTSIKVLVPVSIDSVPRIVTVDIGSYRTNFNQPFILSPPHITSVSPGTATQGQDITITGNGFNPSPELNTVLLDIYPMVIKSSSPTQIVATMPATVPRGNFGISIIVGRYTRSASRIFSFDSQWLRIDAPQMPTSSPWAYYDGMSIYAKSVKNLGYLYSEVSKETYKFDPADRAFTRLNTSSPFDSYFQVKMGEVVCKDTFYLICGHMNNNYNMWAFNDVQNQWEHASAVPTNQAGVAFALNDKIYFGLDFYYPSLWFFECDPAGNFSWNRLEDFPGSPPLHFATYFTVRNKGYVVFSDNSVWQFDPDLKLWTRKADFPGPARELAFSFIMSDKAYMGSGRLSYSDTDEYNDLWEYDPGTDVWVFKTYLPGNRHSAVAFSIGNKAYIGFGLHYANYLEHDLFDFYEYDPNYPAK